MKNMKNENAVSPVIGVILMVVITVIIAAVLAVFAFGVGAPEREAPDAALKINLLSETTGLELVHGGGDSVPLDGMVMSFKPDDSVAGGDIAIAGPFTTESELGTDGFFDPGETIVIPAGSLTGIAAGNIARIRVIDTASGKPIMDAAARVVGAAAAATP